VSRHRRERIYDQAAEKRSGGWHGGIDRALRPFEISDKGTARRALHC